MLRAWQSTAAVRERRVGEGFEKKVAEVGRMFDNCFGDRTESKTALEIDGREVFPLGSDRVQMIIHFIAGFAFSVIGSVARRHDPDVHCWLLKCPRELAPAFVCGAQGGRRVAGDVEREA